MILKSKFDPSRTGILFQKYLLIRSFRSLRCARWSNRVAVLAELATCAPQKVDPALIARFRPDMVGCFWPVFFFADHNPRTRRL